MRQDVTVRQLIAMSVTGVAIFLIGAGCAGSAPAQPSQPAAGATGAPAAASSPTAAMPSTATKSAPAASPAVAGSPTITGQAASGDPIVIFMPLPFTGPTADIGIYWDEGAKVAVKEINESGGIMGRPIDFRVADDQAKPDVYVRLIREFAGQGGNLLFGGSGSAGCLAAAPVIQELNVVLLATACQTTKMTAENYVPNFFRATTNAEITSRSAALVMHERHPNLTKWSTISPDYEFGHNTWEIFAKQMKELNPSFTVVREAFPPFLSPTFQSYITAVQAAQPEGMF
ncbi:MAG TPA: ABC transporter substrate-binding protein, partial [Dehalococcoidia bacterium]|nr:ABC transporter substrate-binding protein [Dehalococcoidia bacterium]